MYYKRRNKLIWVIVLAVIIIGFVWAYNSGKVNVNDNVCNEIIPEEVELSENLNIFYTEVFNGRLTYVEASHLTGDAYPYNNSKTNWNDGQTIDISGKCYWGHLEGENVNLVYCNDLDYSKTTTPVSKEGVVGKTQVIAYSVNLILEKEKVNVLSIPESFGFFTEIPVTTYKVISYTCKR